MAIELTHARPLPRPWGVTNFGQWSRMASGGATIGEIWYDRPNGQAQMPSLLLKLLFTSQPLSIQVHPDDDYARRIGRANGKSEAWYVLSAAPGAKVALGLKQHMTSQQLRGSIEDGSISELVAWQAVSEHDVIFVPAGTIHAIGAGLIIAEIQQRSESTFRLFDYGRQRELHIDSAIAVAKTGPAAFQLLPKRLSNERTLFVSSLHFVFEQIELAPGTAWGLEAERETWLLVMSGSARAGSFDVAKGDAIFAQTDVVDIHAGADGVVCLVAYTGLGGSIPQLLRPLEKSDANNTTQQGMVHASLSGTSLKGSRQSNAR